MIHESELGEYAKGFPRDLAGHVPVHGDCWRKMRFDLAGMDPDAKGISADERARRIEFLDTVWWPQVLARVRDERQRLESAHGESFINHWERVVNRGAEEPHGYEVE